MNCKFKDNKGTEWVIRITLPALTNVRDQLDIDLGNLEEFAKVASNLIDLANTVYVLCQDQATARGISDEEFGERLIGDPLENARAAFDQAYLNFVPGRRREVLRNLLAMGDQAELVEERIVDQALQKLKNHQGTYTSSATNLQEYLE